MAIESVIVMVSKWHSKGTVGPGSTILWGNVISPSPQYSLGELVDKQNTGKQYQFLSFIFILN